MWLTKNISKRRRLSTRNALTKIVWAIFTLHYLDVDKVLAAAKENGSLAAGKSTARLVVLTSFYSINLACCLCLLIDLCLPLSPLVVEMRRHAAKLLVSDIAPAAFWINTLASVKCKHHTVPDALIHLDYSQRQLPLLHCRAHSITQS